MFYFISSGFFSLESVSNALRDGFLVEAAVDMIGNVLQWCASQHGCSKAGGLVGLVFGQHAYLGGRFAFQSSVLRTAQH